MRAGVFLAAAVGTLALSAGAAVANPATLYAVYDSGSSCSYAGYYGKLAGRWTSYTCEASTDLPGHVELWVRR